MINKPMLSGRVTSLSNIRYPVLATPKLDGVRALKIKGALVSRNWKPIPNTYLRNLFAGLPDNVDGELIGNNGKPAGMGFNDTQSRVMREDGEPNVIFHIFDYVKDRKNKPYEERIEDLKKLSVSAFIKLVLPKIINNEAELLEYEQLCIELGYEGVMLRAYGSPYKEGRSTEKEGWLLKLKRFEDSEAVIIAFEERQHNTNVKEYDAFGNSKRSTAQAGMVGKGDLGKLYVKDIKTNVEFEIGTGFDDQLRKEIWDSKEDWLGVVVKYKYQAKGMKDKPRFPVYIGVSNEGKDYIDVTNVMGNDGKTLGCSLKEAMDTVDEEDGISFEEWEENQ